MVYSHASNRFRDGNKVYTKLVVEPTAWPLWRSGSVGGNDCWHGCVWYSAVLKQRFNWSSAADDGGVMKQKGGSRNTRTFTCSLHRSTYFEWFHQLDDHAVFAGVIAPMMQKSRKYLFLWESCWLVLSGHFPDSAPSNVKFLFVHVYESAVNLSMGEAQRPAKEWDDKKMFLNGIRDYRCRTELSEGSRSRRTQNQFLFGNRSGNRNERSKEWLSFSKLIDVKLIKGKIRQRRAMRITTNPESDGLANDWLNNGEADGIAPVCGSLIFYSDSEGISTPVCLLIQRQSVLVRGSCWWEMVTGHAPPRAKTKKCKILLVFKPGSPTNQTQCGQILRISSRT